MENLDEQILNILRKKRYVEESELFSHLANISPKEERVTFKKLLHLISEGKIKRLELYDIRCKEMIFITLPQHGYEVFEELIAKGYRTKLPRNL